MSKRVCFTLIALIISTLPLHAKHLEGMWEDKSFSIELDKNFHEVEGYWGNVKYTLDISSGFQDLDGYVGSKRVDLDFSNSFSSIRGTLPCGKVDLSISRGFNSFNGRFCGQRVELSSFDGVSAKRAAEDLVLNELMESFPKPLRKQIFSFIRNQLKLTEDY